MWRLNLNDGEHFGAAKLSPRSVCLQNGEWREFVLLQCAKLIDDYELN